MLLRKENMFFDKFFSSEVASAAEVAVTVGQLIANGKWSNEMKTKSHPTFGTSSVTEADIGGQQLAIAALSDQFRHAKFIAEEEGNAFPGNFDNELDFSVDIIDGTTPFRHALFMWCSAIGIGRSSNHVGGVVFAPEVRGGLTIAGERGRGVFLWEHGFEEPVRVSIGKRRAKPVIALGVDVLRRETYGKFVSALPKVLKPRGIAESGALGLALVAAGRLDAIVQSPQMPWDWCGGLPMVLEAGGAFQCFHIEGGRVVSVERPTAEDYNTKEQTLGFVAGEPGIVKELFAILQGSVV